MSDHAPSQPVFPSGAPATVPAPLRLGVHLLVAALLALAAGRSALVGLPGWPVVATCSAAVAVVYAVGVRWKVASRSMRAAGAWLAVLLTTWAGLLVLTPDAIYLAFPWFFLLLYLLPRYAALPAVVLTTVGAVAGFGWHQETFTFAMVLGPVLGAAAAIATVFGYQAVQAESEQRRQLIIELDRTRTELSAAQHRAGVLDERERLAREIHDTLAQGLTSIQLLLAAATRSLAVTRSLAAGQAVDAGRSAADASERAATLVEQARRAAQENLDEARRFVRALSPADLESSTLAAALHRLCASTTSRVGIPVSFHEVGHLPALATPIDVALLRIAQSALGNVVQHAHSSRADVTLTGMDTAVTLDIVDDGIGFDAREPIRADQASTGQGGFGLRSMRSRAADVGGVLSVESQPGRGTAVSVYIELARVPPAAAADRPATAVGEVV